MRRCHFDFETRPPVTESYALEPFFGVAVLFVLGWILLHHLVRRERRLAVYVPLAGLLALFGVYVSAGAGFAWRYTGDFWPLIVLACVEYVRVLPAAANRLLGAPLALGFTAISAAVYLRQIEPAETTVLTLAPEKAAVQWDAFNDSRWAMDAPVPSHIECGDRLVALVNNGLGWSPGCFVNTFTNVYLGVPAKRDDGYIVRFQVEGASDPTLEVYVNGRIYTARAIWQRLRRGRAHPIPRADVAHRGGDHPVDAEPRPPPDQAADHRDCVAAMRAGTAIPPAPRRRLSSRRDRLPRRGGPRVRRQRLPCAARPRPVPPGMAPREPRSPRRPPRGARPLERALRSGAPSGGDPRLGQHHDAQRHRRRHDGVDAPARRHPPAARPRLGGHEPRAHGRRARRAERRVRRRRRARAAARRRAERRLHRRALRHLRRRQAPPPARPPGRAPSP